MENLTAKQALFVREYLIDLNATQAAIRAGYSAHTANEQGARLLAKASVKAAIAEASEKTAEKLELKAERVLQAICEVAFGDIRKMFDENGALKRPKDWDDETAATVAGLEVVTVAKGEGAVEYVAKIKRADRLKALDMLARHYSLYNDKFEVNGVDALADRLLGPPHALGGFRGATSTSALGGWLQHQPPRSFQSTRRHQAIPW